LLGILRALFEGKKVLVSHYLNLKLRLIAMGINAINKRVLVVDENNYLVRTGVASLVGENATIIHKPLKSLPPGISSLVFIEPSKPPRKTYVRNVLLTVTPSNKLRVPRYYSRVYLKELSNNLYELHFTDTMEKYRLRLRGLEFIVEERPFGVYGRAYEVLRRAIVEYGELRIRDAVLVLTSELGLDKSRARIILSKLLSEKYFKVDKGRITIY